MTEPFPLAGVRFEAVPPPAVPALPRMDVAAFAGFAASGPVGVPFLVEDPLRFRELFGPDMDLAWDDEAGAFVRSHLGAAVEAFFANGGTRAWVVRIAGPAVAEVFPVPGLADAGSGVALRLAARSPGTWAGALEASAEIVSWRLQAGSAAVTSSGLAAGIVPDPGGPEPGDLVQIVLPGETLVGFARVRSPLGTSLAAEPPVWTELGATGALDVLAPGLGEARRAAWAAGSSMPRPQLSLLRLTLRARLGDGPVLRLADLGLCRGHRRWAGGLLDDAALLAAIPEAGPQLPAAERAFRASQSVPRFPLASLADPAPDATGMLLPLGLSGQQVLAAGGVAEDGLDSFGAGLFLDRDLAGVGVGALAGEADDKLYLKGRPLAGLHAIWPIGEVALAAIPDAVHRPWRRICPPVESLSGAPDPVTLSGYGPDAIAAGWADIGADRYDVQRASEPDFAFPETASTEESSILLDLSAPCPHRHYLRVRGVFDGVIGPWSQTRGARLPLEDAAPCHAAPIRHLWLSFGLAGSPTMLQLSWAEEGASPPPPVPVEVQSAFDAAFVSAETVFAGSGTDWTTGQPTGAARYMRARIKGPDGPHPWSNTVIVPPAPRSEFSVVPARAFDPADLVALHTAALRLAAARADLTVLLSLPRHYRARDAIEHVARLSGADANRAADVPGLTQGELRVLSYGGLFHPWILARRDDAIRAEPPDGAAMGVAAETARLSGAWISPSNRALRGALGLTETPDRETRARLEAVRLTPVIRDPRGFLTMSDWTLAGREGPQQMTVRRLLILLRRLALREGRPLVFEPQDSLFPARVRQLMERMLNGMYLRGAFAGATASQGFRVIADAALNTAVSRDAGRFIVELRVAPSLPLRFLRVALVARDNGLLDVEELT